MVKAGTPPTAEDAALLIERSSVRRNFELMWNP